MGERRRSIHVSAVGMVAPMPEGPKAGWYWEPSTVPRLRRWDGERWTRDVHPRFAAVVVDVDGLEPASPLRWASKPVAREVTRACAVAPSWAELERIRDSSLEHRAQAAPGPGGSAARAANTTGARPAGWYWEPGSVPRARRWSGEAWTTATAPTWRTWKGVPPRLRPPLPEEMLSDKAVASIRRLVIEGPPDIPALKRRLDEHLRVRRNAAADAIKAATAHTPRSAAVRPKPEPSADTSRPKPADGTEATPSGPSPTYENVEVLRQVQELLRRLEKNQLPADDSETGASAITFSWPPIIVGIVSAEVRAWTATVTPATAVTDDDQVGPWRRVGNSLQATWVDTPAETVAIRIAELVRVPSGAGFRLPADVTYDGTQLAEWLHQHTPMRRRFRAPIPGRGDVTPVPASFTTRPIEDLGGPGGADRADPWLGHLVSGAAVHRWNREARPVLAAARRVATPLAPTHRLHVDAGDTTKRIAAGDVPALQAALADSLAEPAASDVTAARAAELLVVSKLVLVDAAAADAVFDSEPIPTDWIADLHVPYPAITLLWTAPFRIPGSRARSLVTVTADCWHADVIHRLAAGPGPAAVIGVTLTALEDRLADILLWHVAGPNGMHTIPALRTRGLAGGHIAQLATWLAAHRRQRPARQARPPRRDTTAPARSSPSGSVIELKIEARSAPRPPALSGPSVAPHIRRGHWRRQRCGPHDDWWYEYRWIAPTYVGGTGPEDSRTRVYVFAG
jgi:hypothetical protein